MHRLNRKFYDWMWGYIFVAPTIIGLVVLNIWPVFQTAILSFSKDLGFNKYELSGLENYERLIGDELVWFALRNTVTFAFLSVPIGIFIAIIIASMLSMKLMGTGFYRVIYFMPMIATSAAVAMVWRWIYNTDYGILNAFLGLFGIESISWISDPQYAMASMVIIAVWGGLGNQIIILIAAITSVSKSYYEAAQIDGAGPVKKLFNITIPLISPSIFFLTVTGLIAALRQFDMVFMIYNNSTNPAINSVRTIIFQYYNQAFTANNKAYASAIVMLAFVVILIFTLIQFIAQKKLVHYN